MPAHRRPFAAFLRPRRRPAPIVVVTPLGTRPLAGPPTVVCRHGLTACDHCRHRPISYSRGVSAAAPHPPARALLAQTLLLPTIRRPR